MRENNKRYFTALERGSDGKVAKLEDKKENEFWPSLIPFESKACDFAMMSSDAYCFHLMPQMATNNKRFAWRQKPAKIFAKSMQQPKIT